MTDKDDRVTRESLRPTISRSGSPPSTVVAGHLDQDHQEEQRRRIGRLFPGTGRGLSYGWIDGQKDKVDEVHWLQRFTPRMRTRSGMITARAAPFRLPRDHPRFRHAATVANDRPRPVGTGWIPIFTGLSVAQFQDLVDIVAARGGEQSGAGRRWGLSLADRVLLTVVYYRTNLTFRQIALLFGMSKSAVGRAPTMRGSEEVMRGSAGLRNRQIRHDLRAGDPRPHARPRR